MPEPIPHMTSEEYSLLDEFITRNFGLTFPIQKKEIFESRLWNRMKTLRLNRYLDYYLYLQCNNNGELSHLADAVTNNETYFFRETYQFQALFEMGLDSLKPGARNDSTFRFLCAGCSSGEEPYTLNIYARENQFRMWGYGVEIDAIDIDTDRISKAKRAVYANSSLRALTETQLQRYFGPPAAEGRPLKAVYRSGVRFSIGNILQPSSFPGAPCYDAVFCRNVLIYFTEDSLKRAVSNFARCLKAGGLLFLGHSESIIGLSTSFESFRLGDCIAYRKRSP